MRYLGMALYAEGPTDYALLTPLLQRLCEDVCARHAVEPVEIGALVALDDPPRMQNLRREERILASAKAAWGAWNVLFVHADAAGDARRARQERTAPALDLLRQIELGQGVAVVPVRETEAWTLADGDALRAVLGVPHSDADLGLPGRARGVEQITDPKATLRAAQSTAGRRRMRSVDLLHLLGERISLERLAHVPAFEELRSDLVNALVALRVLSAEAVE